MCRNSRNCDDAVADCLNCEKRDSKVREVYPDLTKPSNFVKLLKIHPKGTSSFFHKCEEFIHSIYGVKSLEEDIINAITNKVFPSLTTRHKNLAKQQAQATKWDY